MGYDDEAAVRIREYLRARAEFSERPIVGGGLGFMVRGHLCCGLSSRGLTIRVGPDEKAAALRQPNVRPHLVGRRETRAFVVIEAEGYERDADLGSWIDRGLEFVRSLPQR